MGTVGRMRAIAGNGTLPSPTALRGSVGGGINLWYFHSPKNRRKFVFCGDLVFLQAILLEADPAVCSYASPGGTATEERFDSNGPQLIAHNSSGEQTSFLMRYSDADGGSAAKAVGDQAGGDTCHSVCVTDTELRSKHMEIDNWIFLCAAMNRMRSYPAHIEAEALRRAVSEPDGCTLGCLLAAVGADPALMLGSIAMGIQRGGLSCDLKMAPITLSTVLSKVRRS